MSRGLVYAAAVAYCAVELLSDLEVLHLYAVFSRYRAFCLAVFTAVINEAMVNHRPERHIGTGP